MLMRVGVAWSCMVMVAAGVSGSAGAGGPERIELEYRQAPAENPMKGLVPYAGERRGFPHSLEFDYVGLAELMTGPGAFDWGPIEERLDAISGRGHQAVFRVYLEYPGKVGLIPEFLKQQGVTVHRYRVPDPPVDVETPDYENATLRKALRDFIAAFGERYDGDPRLGFLTAGLLGHWGEWHTYPREELFASKEVQEEVMDAFEAAFPSTPILLRYPAGPEDDRMASNADRPFGYHDDSFAWATLDTGRRGDSWFYIPLLKAAGPGAVGRWKSQPIGGEIRPEAWGKVFDEDPGNRQIQDFGRCVEETHASWLMDSGMFRRNVPGERRRRAEEAVRRLGYEFHAASAEIGEEQGGARAVSVTVENRGVAPFYLDWRPEFGLLKEGEEPVIIPCEGSLIGLLPGDAPRTWTGTVDCAEIPSGGATLAVRVPNPLPNGLPIRFANTSQDADRPGWLSLGSIAP